MIIGQREFSIRNTPLRNYTGNKISTFLFFLKYKKVIDTQCGLRGIPYRIFRASLKIKEDNYAFEQKFLNKFFKLKKNLKFIKIKTIYNKKIRSHFKPVRTPVCNKITIKLLFSFLSFADFILPGLTVLFKKKI